LCVVQLHTDAGLTGLGEAFFHAGAVDAYLHESIAPLLIGSTDPTPEAVAQRLAPYVGFQGGGVENRGNGAVDIALWDLLGKQAGLPVASLLGGAVRESVPIYNTCAGPGYVSRDSRQVSNNWGLSAGTDRWEDLDAFLNRPAALARELLDEGITAMKIWPFDRSAERTGGTAISRAELEQGLRLISDIRDAVDLEMDVMIELHGLWDRRGAELILDGLAPYRPYWVEDPLRVDAIDALADLRSRTSVPIATGETCVGRRGFLPLLQRNAVDVVTVDVQWTGGLTEARKVATLTDGFGVPIAPHDCTGPITLAACAHLVMSQPNGLLQETVRAFLRTWYDELVVGLPAIEGGRMELSDRPGLGVRLRPDIDDRLDVVRRMSSTRERTERGPDVDGRFHRPLIVG
jgi:L-alanine-DL-glutamate epimerase-like enolase superfamily enzyme